MKYRNIGTSLGHRILIRKRESTFDQRIISESKSTSKVEDHSTMKSHVFASFQKEQFQKRREDRQRRYIIRFLVLLITLIIVFGFLWVLAHYDFDYLKSSEF